MSYPQAPPSPPSEWRSFEFSSSLPPGALNPSVPGYSPAAPPPPPPRPSGGYSYHGPPPTFSSYGDHNSSRVDHSGALNNQWVSNVPSAAPSTPPTAPARPGRDSMTRKPLPTPPGAPSPISPARVLPYSHSQQPQPPSSRGRALPTPPSARSAAYASPDHAGALNSTPPSHNTYSPMSSGRTPSVSTTSTYPTTASAYHSDPFDNSSTDHTHDTNATSIATDNKPYYDKDGFTETPMPDDVYGVDRSMGLLSIPEKDRGVSTPSAPSTVVTHESERRSYHGESNGSSSALTNRAVSPLPQVGFPSPNPVGGNDYNDGYASSSNNRHEQSPSWAADSSRPWVQTKLLLHQSGAPDDGYYYDEDLYGDYGASSVGEEEEEEMNEIRFFNPAYLSEMAVQVRDRVVRGHHVKGGITWVGTFTGKDLIATIQSLLPSVTRDGPTDHRFAIGTARSLHSQLWVVEVDWDDKPIRDSPEVVFKFMSEMEGMHDVALPKGVLTMATKCYAPSCTGDGNCYAPRCPHKAPASAFLTVIEDEPSSSRTTAPSIMVPMETDWTESVDPVLLAALSDSQRERQTLIHSALLEEEKYEADLAALETVFMTPLLTTSPPIVEPRSKLEEYIRVLFGNILDIRRASRLMLENYGIRLREQSPIVQNIGDLFLEAATDFRALYPMYTDNLPQANELLNNAPREDPQFAQWLDTVSRSDNHRWDVRYLLKRPATYLQSYPDTIARILKVTPGDHPDYDFLHEALSSIQNISYISQLKLFHASKGRGPNFTLEWNDIVSPDVIASMPSKEMKRQCQIWELIKGEMEYVRDLEAIETVFITPLRESNKEIIPRERLETFLDQVFHNYRSILDIHRDLLAKLQDRQMEQHPNFGMVSDLLLDAALNWNDAYLEYIPNYPLSKAKVDAEKVNNPAFSAFLDDCLKNPLALKLDLYHYINRPIPRLVRYPMLLTDILACQKVVGPPDHPDIEAIPQVLELINKLAKAGDRGVAINTAKVELWHLKTTLDKGKFSRRTLKELDLLNPMRELIHKGKVYRQPDGTLSSAWSELYLLLFDNYFVLVKQVKVKHKDAPARYSINRRPVPLELLSIGDFSQPAQNRSMGLLKNIRSGRDHEGEETQAESRTVYPFTYSFIGQGAGQYTLWTDSAAARQEWRNKLQHAKVLRTEVNAADTVFEFETLSSDTFYMAPYGVNTNSNDNFTGRVTCSVPFVTVDGRSLIAVGCEQGVWIGVRKDPPSLRKVLHVRSVTHIAVLEEFGIFLVLADRSLLAYHIEALVPTAQSPQVRTAPERLSGVRDIAFFAVGKLKGRMLVIYVKHKGVGVYDYEANKQTESVFGVLEPIHIRERAEPQRRLGMILGQKVEWFRVYKDFYIPTEAVNVHFLQSKLAIICQRGFEIMDLTDLKGGAIPQFSSESLRNPLVAELKSRHDTTRSLAMFRSTSEEFLLCYATFGMYVNRYGEPSRDMQPIEWEGTPESVVFHPPYILLVSPSFIEVRHIDTAKLVQIYTGSDMRCTWDGTGARKMGMPGANGWGAEVTDTSPRLHICKRAEKSARGKGIGQHLYELVPTLLLNNPLLNPAHTNDPNYFPPAPEASYGTAAMGHLRPDAPLSNGYNGSQQTLAVDRRSVSSVSTATFPTASPYPSSPVVASGMHPFPTPNPGRRVSDQSYMSSSNPGGSGFNAGGGFTAVDDYADYGGHRSQNTYHDAVSQRIPSGGQAQHQQAQHQQLQPQAQPQSAASQYAHQHGQHARPYSGYQSNQNPSASVTSLPYSNQGQGYSNSTPQTNLPPRTASYGNAGNGNAYRPRTSGEGYPQYRQGGQGWSR